MSVDVLARFRGGKLRRLVAWHCVIVVSFLVWRLIENTPATSSVQGSTFTVTPFGRGLVLVLVLASAASSVAIAIDTYLARREWIAWGLLAAWLAALAQRESVDALDFVYVLCTTIAAAAAFASRRD